LVDPCRNTVSFRVKEYFKEIGGTLVPKAEFLENLATKAGVKGFTGGNICRGGEQHVADWLINFRNITLLPGNGDPAYDVNRWDQAFNDEFTHRIGSIPRR